VNQNENPFGEAMLRQAFIEYHRRELAALPPEAELAKLYTFSAGHEARMKALLAKADRRVFWHKAVRASRRVAAAVLIAVTLLFGLLLTHPEVQAAVQKVFVEWHDTFTRFAFSDTQVVEPDVEWQLAYVPEGFEETYHDFASSITDIELQSADGGFVRFRSSPASGSVRAVDNEHSVYASEVIDGVEYHKFSTVSADFYSHLVWEAKGYAFAITSSLDMDTLMEMALSAEPKK
jgi:hypothetical protein